jgi:hypothetical protein
MYVRVKSAGTWEELNYVYACVCGCVYIGVYRNDEGKEFRKLREDVSAPVCVHVCKRPCT